MISNSFNIIDNLDENPLSQDGAMANVQKVMSPCPIVNIEETCNMSVF